MGRVVSESLAKVVGVAKENYVSLDARVGYHSGSCQNDGSVNGLS